MSQLFRTKSLDAILGSFDVVMLETIGCIRRGSGG